MGALTLKGLFKGNADGGRRISMATRSKSNADGRVNTLDVGGDIIQVLIAPDGFLVVVVDICVDRRLRDALLCFV